MGFRARYDAFDRFQQRHPWLGFVLAVRQKYSDDQGGYLAATLSYYGFFSIFPLLLVAATVLGFVLRGHPALQRSILHSAVAQFPLVGDQLQAGSLRGSVLALVVGLVLALWSGMGVFLAAESSMDTLWGIPFRRRPDFLRARLRALGLLLVLGGGVLGATVLSSAGTFGASYGVAWKVGAIALSTALDVGIAWLALRLLTANDVSWSVLRGGAIAAGVAWQALQAVGGWYVGHELRSASTFYGTFAGVIALLSFIFLSAHVLLLAAEGNVVATRKLWPRSFSVIVEEPATPGDKRALEQRAKVEERRSDERVHVAFPPDE